jgi:hypothetical protein
MSFRTEVYIFKRAILRLLGIVPIRVAALNCQMRHAVLQDEISEQLVTALALLRLGRHEDVEGHIQNSLCVLTRWAENVDPVKLPPQQKSPTMSTLH